MFILEPFTFDDEYTNGRKGIYIHVCMGVELHLNNKTILLVSVLIWFQNSEKQGR